MTSPLARILVHCLADPLVSFPALEVPCLCTCLRSLSLSLCTIYIYKMKIFFLLPLKILSRLSIDSAKTSAIERYAELAPWFPGPLERNTIRVWRATRSKRLNGTALLAFSSRFDDKRISHGIPKLFTRSFSLLISCFSLVLLLVRRSLHAQKNGPRRMILLEERDFFFLLTLWERDKRRWRCRAMEDPSISESCSFGFFFFLFSFFFFFSFPSRCPRVPRHCSRPARRWEHVEKQTSK